MKTVNLNSVTLLKNGTPIELMGVTDKGWNLLYDITVPDGSSDVRYVDILNLNDKAIEFKKMRVTFFLNGASGNNNYFNIYDSDRKSIAPQIPFYIHCGHTIAIAEFDNSGEYCKYSSVSTSNGHVSDIRNGYFRTKLPPLKILRLQMNGSTSNIGTGTRILVEVIK